MKKKQIPKLNLTIETGDEAAEIFIIDSQFQRLANAIGAHAVFQLPRGLYTVKVTTGSDCQEKPVTLREDQAISFDPIEFSTAVPLNGTSNTHEYQVDNAINHSQKIHVTIGEGSQVYIFARDWTSKIKSAEIEILKHTPAKGLKLCDQEGEVLVDFEKESDLEIGDDDPWAACNININPGTYRLRLETNVGDILEQTIVASQGWQTQIFLLQRNYGFRERDLRADLPGASIFMTPFGEGFKSSKMTDRTSGVVDFRLAELVRQALINDRQRLSEKILRQALNGKFRYPMTGIYGAHLLLRNKDHDVNLLKTVINNLRELLREPHPDVEALAIKANLGSNYIFNMPPMLRSSWVYLLEASVLQPDLVPENSIAAQVAGSLWSEGIWLIWGRSASQPGNDEILLTQIKKLTQTEVMTDDAPNLPPDILMSKDAITFDIGNTDIQAMPEPASANFNIPIPELNNDKILQMVQSLGIPRSKLEALLKNVVLD